MYKDACAAKGIKVTAKTLAVSGNNQRQTARSAKIEITDRDKN